jgi:diguanylate cyclase (GGDEF)-like protein/PAS domain S-box-containing protein
LEADLRLRLKDRLDVLSAGGGVEGLLGYKPADLLLGLVRLDQFIHPDDMPAMLSLFSLAAPRKGELSARMRRSDGAMRCFWLHSVRERTRQGETLLTVNISDPAHAVDEPEIGESAVDLLAVLDSLGQSACLKDRHHVIRKANPSFHALVNGGARSLAGLTDYDLLPEEYADRSYSAEEQVLAGSADVHFSLRATGKQGVGMGQGGGWGFDCRIFPVSNEGGAVTGLCAVVLNAAVRSAPEEATLEQTLRESEASLRETERIVGLGSFVFDVETQTWTASEGLYEILGLDRNCPRTVAVWIDLILKEDHAQLGVLFGQMVAGSKTFLDAETRFVRQTDGELRWARVRGTLARDAGGSPCTLRGIIEDITKRKTAEAEVRRSAGLLHLFIHDAPTGLAMLDRELHYIKASQRWIEDRGLNEWEINGRSIYDFQPHPEAWKEDHRRALAGETVPFREERYEQEDGTPRWVRRMVQPWREMDGTIGGIVVLSEDVTAHKEAENALRESREMLELFIQHAPTSIAMFDREMCYLAASRRWIEDYGLTGQEILGRSHYEVFPELPERWKEAHRRGMAGEGLRTEAELFERSNGTKLWVRWELLPWKKSDGTIGGIVLFTEDVTAIKASVERLQLAASVFTHSSESIVITDANGAILDVNRAFTQITGYTREEVLGRNPRLLNSGRQGRDYYLDMWSQLKEVGQWSGEIWNRTKSGTVLPGMMTISAVPDAEGKTKQYVALFSDLSPIKEQERQLQQVAHFDVLTGLPNRASLADRLQQAMAHSRRLGQLLAVVYLDLDNFSAINEQHGHTVGDQLLTALTRRMHAVIRGADTLARLGGDEFAAVLLDLANIEEGLGLIGSLRDAVAEPVQLGDLELRVTASLGVSLFPQADDVAPDQLVRQADQAMYVAKLAGKGRYHVFDPMLDRSMRGRHEDLQRIRQAMHAKEFELYFQPKVNMRTGAVLGAEALIRWKHPELGLLSPDHFLPVMEGNVLVVELGEWVIASALVHMAQWRERGLDIPVSVNVDALQLQEPHFVDRLKELLAEHPGIDPSRLELEILESSAFRDVSQVSEVIRRCSKLGVSFALDDFGTGYSSLSYLKRLPVDVLKIDQSFVRDMLDDPEDLSILEGVLVLASAFRRQAIAEGVETVDHGLMLLRLGCPIAQGYQIARPMPGSDLPAWAAAWRPDPRWMNVKALDPAKWPVLHAGVEHRAWIGEFEEFVHGRRPDAPPMDPHSCQLGLWLHSEASAGRGEGAEMRAIDDLHQRLHTQANGILDSKRRNSGALPLAGLDELRTLRDGLFDQLQHVVQAL